LEEVVESGRLSEAALNSTYATRATTRIKTLTKSSPQVGAFVRKLKTAQQSAVVTVLGDSTSAAEFGWSNLLMGELAALFPTHRVLRRSWESANERYGLVPTIVQAGPSVRRFVSTGASTDRFFTVADSAATSPSTEVRVEFDILIPASGVALTLGGKYDTGTNNRGWFVQITNTGILQFFFSTDGTSGTQLTRAATAALPAPAFGVRTQIRVTWQGNDGAGNNVTRFEYSLDLGATWTQIGSTVTTATASATIFDASTATQFNSRGGIGNATGGAVEYFGFRLFTSLAAGARPVIDFDTALWNGFGSAGSTASFLDFVGNTVVINGTGTGGAMQGAPIIYVLNAAVSGQTISYANDATRFPKLTAITSDLMVVNFSHNEVGLVAYRAPYKQLTDAVLAKFPDAGIVATIQNARRSPAINIVEHAIRGDSIAALAGSENWAVVDAAGILNATGDPAAFTNVDGIHPNQDGYDLIAETSRSLFTDWLPDVA